MQPVLCLCFNETLLVTGSKDYKCVFAWPPGTCFLMTTHSDSEVCVYGRVLVWDLASQRVVRKLEGHHAAVNALSLKSVRSRY